MFAFVAKPTDSGNKAQATATSKAGGTGNRASYSTGLEVISGRA